MIHAEQGDNSYSLIKIVNSNLLCIRQMTFNITYFSYLVNFLSIGLSGNGPLKNTSLVRLHQKCLGN